MTCARARRSQLQSMIDTPQECKFLAANWGLKGLDWELLSQGRVRDQDPQLSSCSQLRVPHFLDHQADEEAAAKALQDRTQLALHDAAEDDAPGVKNFRVFPNPH